MALFGKKEEKEGKTEKKAAVKKPVESKARSEPKEAPKSAPNTDTLSDLSWVLTAPRMSEKAMYAADKNVYMFNINPRANKVLIKEALKQVYKVVPAKVNVSKIATKNIRNQRTGVKGVKSGGKKAYVYLKKGDKINIV